MNTRDELCCTVCGGTEDVFEYHMAGYEINDETYSILPVSGGIDYPVEYYWCNNCNAEIPYVELHENWCERTAEEEDEDAEDNGTE